MGVEEILSVRGLSMPTWILPVSLVIVGGGLRRGGRGHVGLQRGEGFPLNWLAPDPGRQERDHSHRHLHRPRVDKAFLARPGAPCLSHSDRLIERGDRPPGGRPLGWNRRQGWTRWWSQLRVRGVDYAESISMLAGLAESIKRAFSALKF